MFPTIFISGGEPITPDTFITLVVDTTSSMGATDTQIISMVSTLLKPALLPYFNNDSAMYDSHVRVVSSSLERFLYDGRGYAATIDQGGDNHVVMVFTDENNVAYHSAYATFDPATERTATFNSDMLAWRAQADAVPAGYYKLAIMQVETSYSGALELLMEACRLGTGLYAGDQGLSDRSEVFYRYEVTNEGGAEYYLTVVTDQLRAMGFAVPAA